MERADFRGREARHAGREGRIAGGRVGDLQGDRWRRSRNGLSSLCGHGAPRWDRVIVPIEGAEVDWGSATEGSCSPLRRGRRGDDRRIALHRGELRVSGWYDGMPFKKTVLWRESAELRLFPGEREFGRRWDQNSGGDS